MASALIIRLAVAALVGLAVGVEREWSGHGAGGPTPRFAGVRTFMLLGGGGGVAGWMAAQGYASLGAVVMAAFALLAVGAYWAAARGGGASLDGTTEVAAILIVALGALAGVGEVEAASGAAAIVVLALSEKDVIRSAVARVDGAELRAALQFAVLALVVLPILPNASYGPLGGINPRSLWIVVLIFSGLNFAGFLVRRAVGASRGYGVTGALGGMISSTVVTLQFARLSRTAPELGRALGLGVIAASTVLPVRILLVSVVLNRAVSWALLPYLLPPLLVGGGWVGATLYRVREETASGDRLTEPASPLRLWSAIQMALAFQAALLAIAAVRQGFGSAGVMASAALLGLTDMDALTLAMNRLGNDAEGVALAARAIALGITANTLLKLILSLALGERRFRSVAAAGLSLLLVASGVTLAVLAPWLLRMSP